MFDHPTNGQIVGSDRPVASVLSPDRSRMFVTGASTDDQTGRDMVTVAFDTTDGGVEWATRHDSPAEGAEQPTDIAVSPDGGRVFVTGYEDAGREDTGTPSEDGRAVALAYDAVTGDLLWRAPFEGPGRANDVFHSVAVAPDGSEVYVSGSARGEDGEPLLVTLALAAESGTRAWVSSRPGPKGQAQASDRSEVAVSPDGSRVYTVGVRFPQEGSSARDLVLVALGAGDHQEAGEELWVAGHDGGGPDVLRGIAVSPEGKSVFVIADSNPRWSVVAFSSSGDLRWASTLQETILAWPRDLVVSPTGDRLYVAGTSRRSLADPADSSAATTVAYDSATGDVAWTAIYDPPGLSTDQGAAVGLSADGETVYVAGSSSPIRGGGGGGGCTPGGTCYYRTEMISMLTLAYDAEGTKLWLARLDDAPGSPVAEAEGVAVGEDQVYVVGSLGTFAASSERGEVSNYSDIVVAAYGTGEEDATGAT